MPKQAESIVVRVGTPKKKIKTVGGCFLNGRKSLID